MNVNSSGIILAFKSLLKNCIQINFRMMYSKPINKFGRELEVENSEELAGESIFWTDKIQVGDKSICYKNWIDNGVFFIESILERNKLCIYGI